MKQPLKSNLVNGFVPSGQSCFAASQCGAGKKGQCRVGIGKTLPYPFSCARAKHMKHMLSFLKSQASRDLNPGEFE